MDSGLRGMRALVTGGASGIGQSVAVGLAGEGVTVRVADIAAADETLRLVREAGGEASATRVDLRAEAEVDAMVEQAVNDGGIDLFVNVAGTYAAEPVTRLSSATWHDVLATNVTACALAGRGVARHMIGRGRGCVLIVGSTVVCAPSYEGAAYRASKVALRSYMETLAIELAPFGVRVNMLTPGPFPTALVKDLPLEQRRAAEREVPLGSREGRLEEVRGAALFLLSDRLASFVTGHELFVDGGLHLRPLGMGSAEQMQRLNSPR